MGYIYTEITSTTFDDFIVELEEKTGIVVKKTEQTGDSAPYEHLTIQFPGKEEVSGASLYFYYTSVSSYTNEITSRMFADVDNELLIMKTIEAENKTLKGGSSQSSVFKFVLNVRDGKIFTIFDNSVSLYYNFNMGANSLDDATLNSIVIYPAYYGSKSIQIKNLYLNSQRAFLCGLVLEDDNGDRYFTLGSYFLYKIN